MKKSLLAIAFAMVAMVGSAQIYVGGSLGLDFAGKDKVSRTGDDASIVPMICADNVADILHLT